MNNQKIKLILFTPVILFLSIYMGVGAASSQSDVIAITGVVVAEVLYCGCSVVGPDVEEIPSMKWFITNHSGQLAPRCAEGLALALHDELKLWGSDERDPLEISNSWTEKFHAPNVARSIVEKFNR